MGLNLEIILFACAFGFTGAAIISLFVMNIERLSPFRLPDNTVFSWIIAYPLMAFTGPYWVAVGSLRALANRQHYWLLGVLGLILTTFWSFCAGVFVVEFLHLLKLV